MADQDDPSTGRSPALERWAGRWRASLAASGAKGQKDDTAWGNGRVEIGPPATPSELAVVDAASGILMPEALRRLFLVARSVDASWHFADDVEPPDPFADIFAGACSWSLDRVVSQIADYRSWVHEAFPNPDDQYDAVWHGKYPWLYHPNGDLAAVDHEGRVVYLSHDDGEGHGYVLGRDVFDFLETWTKLGCPGPEDWQWLPFAAASGEGLDPDGPNGRVWRDWFGLP